MEEEDDSAEWVSVASSKRIRKSKSEKRQIKLTASIESGTNRRLIVLDLNGVLIYRVAGTIRYAMRPHAISLLNHLATRCELALWTSSKKDTVKRLFKTLFTERSGFCQSRFLFVWCQNRCSQEPAPSPHSEEGGDGSGAAAPAKPLFWKEIKKIWDEYPDFAYEGGCYLMDDSLCKLERNPASTRIHVPTYLGPDSSGVDRDDVMKLGGDMYTMLTRLTQHTSSRDDTEKLSASEITEL